MRKDATKIVWAPVCEHHSIRQSLVLIKIHDSLYFDLWQAIRKCLLLGWDPAFGMECSQDKHSAHCLCGERACQQQWSSARGIPRYACAWHRHTAYFKHVHVLQIVFAALNWGNWIGELLHEWTVRSAMSWHWVWRICSEQTDVWVQYTCIGWTNPAVNSAHDMRRAC